MSESNVVTAGGAGVVSGDALSGTMSSLEDYSHLTGKKKQSNVIVAGGVSKSNQLEDDFECVPLEGEGCENEDVIKEEIDIEEDEENLKSPGIVDRKAEELLRSENEKNESRTDKYHDLIWLTFCFFGIMMSFVAYGLLLEYTTSGGRKLHELSFLFVTSVLYTTTAAAGRYVRDEKPTSIPPPRFAVLGLTSMSSTFCSVRSLRYVIYPIQVLAKSCKPVPVMIFGALMGKKYPLRKYINVILIVGGVALFMGGGDQKKSNVTEKSDAAGQLMGIILLFISLCFDGGTGAYEDKLMSVHSVGPFDLMYNIQLGKTILSGVSLLILNQVHVFFQMCQDMGFLLVALGLTGAMGQVFIFITISKFGALTCSIIGLARKVTTLVASIYFYGHILNRTQVFGLVICVTSMLMNFMGGGKKKGHHHHHAPKESKNEESQPMLLNDELEDSKLEISNGIELPPKKRSSSL